MNTHSFHSFRLIILCVFLLGCASTISIKSNEISTVRISQQIKVTDKPEFYSGPGSLFAWGVGGAVGSILVQAEERKYRDYADFLMTSGIDVGEIVLSEFESALKSHPEYGPKLRKDGLYTFSLEVPTHALVQKNSFSDFYRPSVLIRMNLLDPNGKLLATAVGSSCTFGGCVTYQKLNDIRANPNLLIDQYREASRDAIRELMEALKN